MIANILKVAAGALRCLNRMNGLAFYGSYADEIEVMAARLAEIGDVLGSKLPG